MLLKCEKCNIEYSDAEFCEQCGQALVQVDQADDDAGIAAIDVTLPISDEDGAVVAQSPTDNAIDNADQDAAMSSLLDEIYDYEHEVANNEGLADAEGEVADYWSRTEDLAVKQANDSKTADKGSDDQTEAAGVVNSSTDLGEDNADDRKKKKKFFWLMLLLLLLFLIAGLFLWIYRGALFNKGQAIDQTNSDINSNSDISSNTNNDVQQTGIDDDIAFVELGEKLGQDIVLIDESIKQLHDENGLPAYTTSRNGQVYSLTLQKYLKMADLDISNLSNSNGLFASADGLCIGQMVDDQYQYICYNAESGVAKLESTDDMQSFLQEINFQKPEQSQVALLAEGDEDRTQIATVLVETAANADSIIFRYLASDGQNAFAIWSASDDYQAIKYSYLQRDASAVWQLKKHYQQGVDLNTIIAELDAIEGSNLGVLAPLNPVDFNIMPYQQEALDQIVVYLRTRQMVTSSAELVFFSRIDDNAYLEFNDGTRLLILFQNDSLTSFDDIVVFESNQTNQTYIERLKPLANYGGYYPLHVFIQR